MTTVIQHGDMWPEVSQHLYKKYNIIQWIDLLESNIDIDLKKLYNVFYAYKDRVFSPNERIIVVFKDTDYYTSLNEPGFTLWNISSIISYLNLPAEFFILLTFQPGLDKEVQLLANLFNLSPIKTIYTPYQWCPLPNNIQKIDLQSNKITYPYICLNNVPRVHRLYTLARLYHQNIIDNGIVNLATINYIFDHTSNINDNLLDIPPHLHLRGCSPFTRINDSLILTDQQRKFMIDHHPSVFSVREHPAICGLPNSDNNTSQPLFFQLALWNLINETVGDYPYPFISEKTTKAILTKRPFIILGAKNTLSHVRFLGYKTFDQWIDESYDTLDTFADRCDFATNQLEKYCQYSTAKLQSVVEEMQEILEFNYNHYISGFGGTNLASFLDNML